MRSKISSPRKYAKGYLSLNHRSQINKDKSLMLKAMIQLPITLEQLITTVQQLQPSDRLVLMNVIIESLENQPIFDPDRSGAIRRMRGLLKTDRTAPTDEQVIAMLEERRVEKYL